MGWDSTCVVIFFFKESPFKTEIKRPMEITYNKGLKFNHQCPVLLLKILLNGRIGMERFLLELVLHWCTYVPPAHAHVTSPLEDWRGFQWIFMFCEVVLYAFQFFCDCMKPQLYIHTFWPTLVYLWLWDLAVTFTLSFCLPGQRDLGFLHPTPPTWAACWLCSPKSGGSKYHRKKLSLFGQFSLAPKSASAQKLWGRHFGPVPLWSPSKNSLCRNQQNLSSCEQIYQHLL